jgi:hypothetical protein
VRLPILLAAGIAAVAAPSATAVVIPGANQTARLAVGAGGAVWSAYVVEDRLWVARPDSRALPTPVARMPGPGGVVAGIEVDSAGRPAVLVQDARGRWLVLALRTTTRWRTVRLAGSLRSSDVLGPAGLARDRAGRSTVAYALRQPSDHTFLRLVTGLRLREQVVTRRGFPPSRLPPSAAPVLLPTGRIAVLETYATRGTATLLWRRAPGDWFGRFLYSNSLGIAIGPVLGRADAAAVYAAWTVDFPTFGERHVVLARANGRARSTVLSRSGSAAALTVGSSGPEVGLNESVGTGLVAGVIAREDGSRVELDGRLLDFEARGPERHLLAAGPEGVSWYSSPAPLGVGVSLSASRTGSTVVLEGRVENGAGGSVSVYREVSVGPRRLVAVVPLAPDGTFATTEESPPLPSYYRAVYSDPGTGIPFAALLRSPVS